MSAAPIEPRPSVRIRADVPPLAGLRWIRLAFRTFARQPFGFMGMFGLFMLVMVVMSLPLALLMPLAQALGLSPLAIVPFLLVLMPLLSLAFMLSTEAVTNDLRIHPRLFFAPLAASGAARRAMAVVGLVYVGVMLLAYASGNGIDDGAVAAWIRDRLMPPDTAALSAPLPAGNASSVVIGLKMLIVAIGSIPLWHAPALIHWGRQAALPALFASSVALWRTRWAFIVFLVGWLVVGIAVSSGIGILWAMAPDSMLVAGFELVVSWAMSAVFYVTLWFGFVDTFEIVGPASARALAGRPREPGA